MNKENEEHPMDCYREDIEVYGNFIMCSEFDLQEDGSIIRLVGLVKNTIQKELENGIKYLIVTIRDLHGEFELMLVEDNIKKLLEELDINKPVVFKVNVKSDDLGIQFKVLEIESFEKYIFLNNC